MKNKMALIIVGAFLCTYCTQKDISNYSEIFIDFESVKTLVNKLAYKDSAVEPVLVLLNNSLFIPVKIILILI